MFDLPWSEGMASFKCFLLFDIGRLSCSSAVLLETLQVLKMRSFLKSSMRYLCLFL